MNRRRETVGYQPLRLKPLLSEGLLPVAREDGDLQRRVAEGLFHLAGYFGDKADAEATRQGWLDGQKAALEGRTISTIDHDYGIDGALTGAIPADKKGVADVLRKAAAKHGQDGETLVAIAQIESGLNPNAKNPNSSAGGLLQFVDGTAKGYGLANKFDPVQSADAGARLLKDNRTYLAKALGREPTPGELYLAHQQGAGGAAKLLANPNRRASDLVGYDAVRLNGGSATMTAADFASKWTSKVKGKAAAAAPAAPAAGTPMYVGQVNADGTIGTAVSAPPLSGKPLAGTPDDITTGATVTGEAPAAGSPGYALSGGTARPSGRDTVYGRSYDKALVGTYLNNLEAEVGTTTAAVYRKFKDDPQGMAEGFDALRREFLKNHVMPEIAADFEAAFTRKTGAFIEAAYEEQDRKAKENAVAEFEKQTADLETVQQEAVAGFDASSANTAELIAGQQAAIDRHYDEAVKKGLRTPAQAEKEKQQSRRDAALGFYGKQAEGLDADGVEAMRKAMEADFADGGIDGLDGQGWTALDNHLKAAAKTKRIEADQAEADLVQRGDQFAAKIAAGYEPNKEEWTKFQKDAAAAPGGKDHFGEAEAKIAAARAIRDLPLQDAVKAVEKLRTEAGNAPNDSQLRTIGFAESALADKQKALRTDPLSYAEQQKLVPPTGSLADAAVQGPEAMTATLQARAKAVKSVEAHYGVPVKLLKPGEAKAIADMAKTDPAKGAQMAGALVDGAGPHALQVLSEFGDTAPVFAGAGMIIANGGNPAAAEDALAGQSKDIKVKRKPALQNAEWHSVAGDALAFQAGDGKRIMATAASIARKRMDEAGIDPDSEDAAAIHEQAIHEAAGGTFEKGVQFGGFADMALGGSWFDGKASQSFRVLVPPSIRADRLPDLLAAVKDGDIFVKPVGGTGQLAGLVPVAVNGGYAFTDGDPDNPAFLQADNGNVFILDIAALRKTLEPRVPGAFK